jgi:hypothetical protein
MTEPEALVAAAAIGGLAALVGALVAGGTALRNETRRRSAGRKDVERQALRTQAAEVFRHIFALQHEMEWLTWHAVNRPKDLNSRMTAAYESAVHDAYPKVLGAMAVLASMNIDLYQRVTPMVDRIYEMDGEIGRHITGLGSRRTRRGSLEKLKQLNEPVKALYVALPPEMAEAMRHADASTTSYSLAE